MELLDKGYKTQVFDIEVAEESNTLFKTEIIVKEEKARNLAKILKGRFPECDVYLHTKKTNVENNDSVEEIE